jgi:ribosomal protein S27E
MRINCIACGHRFDLDEAYDDYSGRVKCSVCRSMLQISTEGGKVRSVDLAGQATDLPAQPLVHSHSLPQRKGPPRATLVG